MLGLINQSFERFAVARWGEGAWMQALRAHELEGVSLVATHPYPDEVTFKLAAQTAADSGEGLEDVLRAFGRFWIDDAVAQGYGALIDELGDDFGEALANIQVLHTRVGLIFPGSHPPDFRPREVRTESATVEFHTVRPALLPFSRGAFERLAELKGARATIDVGPSQGRGVSGQVESLSIRWTRVPR